MGTTFRVGDFVRYNHPNGSTGKVVYLRDDGPFKERPVPCVEWVYGKDVRGEPMTARSMFYGTWVEHELVKITEEEYMKVYNREGFGP